MEDTTAQEWAPPLVYSQFSPVQSGDWGGKGEGGGEGGGGREGGREGAWLTFVAIYTERSLWISNPS
jgi:hypothetical protein